MKKRKKNSRITVSVLMLLLSILFTACGKAGSSQPQERIPSGEQNLPAPEQETSAAMATPVPTEDTSPVIRVEAVFLEEAHVLPENATAKSVINLGRSLAILWTDGTREEVGVVPYTLDEEGAPCLGRLQQLSFELPFEDCLSYALSTAGDGCFYLLCGDSREGAALSLAVLGFDSDGNLTGTMEIPEWSQKTVDSFCAATNGRLFIAQSNQAFVYEWGVGLVESLQLDMPATCVQLTNKGIVISGFTLETRMFKYQLLDTESLQLMDLDVYAMEPAETYDELWNCLIQGSCGSCQSLDGRLLVNQNGLICAVDLDAATKELLMGWNEGGNVNSVAGPSCQIGEKAFACTLDGKLMLSWQGVVEKHESGRVRVGLVSRSSNGSLMRYLAAAKGADSPYTIETQEFFLNDEASMTKFNAELADGAFDLVIFCQIFSIGSSQFDDLYPYLDSDTELCRKDFLPGLLEGMSVNGKLPQLCSATQIFTMAGKEALVGDGRGLTVSVCEQIVRDNNDVQSVFDNKLSDESSLRYDTLQNLAWMAACSFVDKNTASCSFDSPEFKALLELCGNIRANPDSTGDDFLLYVAQTSNAGSLEYLTERLGPCSYVGYPDGGDGVHYFFTAMADHAAMAIPGGSQNKSAAWGVIKYLLSENQQWNVAGEIGSMPVTRSVVEEYNRQNFSGEQCEKFFDLLERTHYVQTGADTTIREIIMETCRPYLAGDKSLEETVDLLQSKVSIYLAEQYG